MALINMYSLRELGFSKSEVDRFVEGVKGVNPEYGWVSEAVKYPGSKPKVNPVKLIERYREYQHSLIDRELNAIECKHQEVDRYMDDKLNRLEEAGLKWTIERVEEVTDGCIRVSDSSDQRI